jgi:NAD(P)-dependent dehydrogenase (short-subunit alcohol dehydrogenase family)
MSVAAHEFSGQVVIVTGGAQGIGFGIAELFGKHGAKVALFDMQADKLASAVADLEAKSIEAMHAVVNVAVPEDWKNAVDAVLSKYGRIDVLVQAAGITGKTGIKTHEVDPANYDAVMNVNAKGVFLGCHAVLPSMVKADYGRIVNIASVAGKEGNAGMLAYSASKAAVIGITKVVGKDYAESNITCNAVAPAVVRTAMVDAMPAEQVKYMTDKIPMKRCGTITEIATLCMFIASKGCSFTTGFTFDATGGRATY